MNVPKQSSLWCLSWIIYETKENKNCADLFKIGKGLTTEGERQDEVTC